jgi:peroxiredoxin
MSSIPFARALTATLLIAATARIAAATLAPLSASPQTVSSPAGLWNATVTANGYEVPFRFEVTVRGASISGSFFDGDRRITSTQGRLDKDALTLRFDQYGAALEATLKNDALEGRYTRGSRPAFAFKAVRFTPQPKPTGEVPAIAGLWKMATQSSKGEAAWRLIVRQSGAEVSAAILRVDGDTGTLTGTFRDGSFLLSHFSGARPTRLEVTPSADGTLRLLLNSKTTLVAVRADSDRASEVPEPTDPALHTRVKDPNLPFEFRFPDLDGKPVANTDPRFRGKVVLVSITGSWCPNCHDEAPFLSGLYRKLHKKGLEIVALAFEEADQLANPTRLRTFIDRYAIEYPILLAGEPEQLADKIPQAVNLNAFPTTFLLGRDGKVHGVHAGFPSLASGKFYADAQRELTEQVERLLAERAPGTY